MNTQAVQQLVAGGVRDPQVLAALMRVRLEPPSEALALFDRPLVVGRLFIAASVREGMRVLVAGTGASYPAAVARELGAEVFVLEPDVGRAERAVRALAQAEVSLLFRLGRDARAWRKEAPFDAILTDDPGAAHGSRGLLGVGGRLLIPGDDGAIRVLHREREESFVESLVEPPAS